MWPLTCFTLFICAVSINRILTQKYHDKLYCKFHIGVVFNHSSSFLLVSLLRPETREPSGLEVQCAACVVCGAYPEAIRQCSVWTLVPASGRPPSMTRPLFMPNWAPKKPFRAFLVLFSGMIKEKSIYYREGERKTNLWGLLLFIFIFVLGGMIGLGDYVCCACN